MLLILSSEICKVNSQALSSLATETDVTDVINLYHEFFSVNQDGEAPSQVCEPQLPISFGTTDNDVDPGIEVEATMKPESLSLSLGFKDGLPLLFNTLRHKGGLSPWSNPDIFTPPASRGDLSSKPRKGGNLEPLTLFWHQLAGVHAIVRMNFHPTRSSSRFNGTLIADEVGLGKTFQAATVVVFLADLVMRQKCGHPLPPIISSSSLQLNSRWLS